MFNSIYITGEMVYLVELPEVLLLSLLEQLRHLVVPGHLRGWVGVGETDI